MCWGGCVFGGLFYSGTLGLFLLYGHVGFQCYSSHILTRVSVTVGYLFDGPCVLCVRVGSKCLYVAFVGRYFVRLCSVPVLFWQRCP